MRFIFAILIFMVSQSLYANLPSQFTVGSYNLFGINNPQKLKQDLAALDFVDIWAFQEVEGSFNEQTNQKILDILPEGPWYLALQKVNLEKNGAYEGQVIASRFPIENIEVLELNHTDKKDRIALIAHFKTENGENFAFANTDHEVNIFSIDFNDRKKQLESLTRYFNKNNYKAIITGDFNTTGGKGEISNTEEILALANFQRSEPADPDSYTFEKFFIKTELDHFFTRGIASSKRFRFNDREGSDHFPIYINVQIK